MREESKPTPGPWSIENIDGTDVVFDPHHFCICEVTYQENNANALLIAAAPDLLEALEGIQGIEAWINDKVMKELFQKKVYPAIKKARGL